MIKHVVMFKPKRIDNEKLKQDVICKIKSELDKLPVYIPEIKRFETGINFNISERSCDIVLISEFACENDLELYANHTKHLEFMSFFAPYREFSKVVDYYF